MAKPIATQLDINIGLCVGVQSGHVFEPKNKQILICTPASFVSNYCPIAVRGRAPEPAKQSPAKIKLAILDEADMIFQNSKQEMQNAYKVLTKA